MKWELRADGWYLVDSSGATLDGPYTESEARLFSEAANIPLPGESDTPSTITEGPWKGANKSTLDDAYKAGSLSPEDYRKYLGQLGLGEAAIDFAITQNKPVAERPEQVINLGDNQNVIIDQNGQQISKPYATKDLAEQALQRGTYQQEFQAWQASQGTLGGLAGIAGKITAGVQDIAAPTVQRLQEAGFGPGLEPSQIIQRAVDGLATPEDAWLALQVFKGKTPAEATSLMQAKDARWQPPTGTQTAGTTSQATTGPSLPGTITQNFGPGIDLDGPGSWLNPATGKVEYLEHLNKGLDIGAPEGTPAPAFVAGTVVSAGPDGTWGNRVVVKDAQGNLHGYAHLASVNVKAGDTITPGMIVGAIGSTGVSTGPHLSYDVSRPDGVWIDPTQFTGGGGGAKLTPMPGQTGLSADQLGVYTQADVATLYDAARQAGFTGDALHQAVASAIAESRSVGFSAENREGENSIGAWQINLDAHWDKVPGATMEEKSAWLKDPYNAAKIAFQVSSGGTDFSPWTVWHEDRGKPAEAVYAQLSGAGFGQAGPTGEAFGQFGSQLEGLTPKQWADIVARDPSRMPEAEAALREIYASQYTPERIEYELDSFKRSVGAAVKAEQVGGGRARAIENVREATGVFSLTPEQAATAASLGLSRGSRYVKDVLGLDYDPTLADMVSLGVTSVAGFANRTPFSLSQLQQIGSGTPAEISSLVNTMREQRGLTDPQNILSIGGTTPEVQARVETNALRAFPEVAGTADDVQRRQYIETFMAGRDISRAEAALAQPDMNRFGQAVGPSTTFTRTIGGETETVTSPGEAVGAESVDLAGSAQAQGYSIRFNRDTGMYEIVAPDGTVLRSVSTEALANKWFGLVSYRDATTNSGPLRNPPGTRNQERASDTFVPTPVPTPNSNFANRPHATGPRPIPGLPPDNGGTTTPPPVTPTPIPAPPPYNGPVIYQPPFPGAQTTQTQQTQAQPLEPIPAATTTPVSPVPQVQPLTPVFPERRRRRRDPLDELARRVA